MKRLLWLLMVVMMALRASAQYDAAFTNYWALQSLYNPAAAGLNGQLDVRGAYSMQMLGFDDAPATMYVGADLPVFFLSPAHGMGVGFLNDQAGLFSSQKVFLQYAYHQKLGNGRLSIGVRGAFLNETFDGTKVDVDDSSDPAFATGEVKGTAFDADAGVRYTYKKVWYVGLSAMHLTAPTVKLGDDKRNQISIQPLIFLTGGHRLQFHNPQYSLQTAAMLRTDLQNWRGDISARLCYEGTKNKLYAGINYSPMNSVAVLLGLDIHGISLGYSYEMYTGGIGALNGSHELTLGYQTELNFFKKGKNLHKSVRLL